MRNVLLAVVLVVGGAVACAAQDVSHIPSISPLVRGDRIVCTAWSVNQAGYWVTAAHCVQNLDPEQPETLRVASLDAKVVAVYQESDIAVLETVGGVRALTLAKRAPVAGEVLH